MKTLALIAISLMASLILSGCPSPPERDAPPSKGTTTLWETVATDTLLDTGVVVTKRIAVPNGWLYCSEIKSIHGVGVAQTFVPLGPDDTNRRRTMP